MKTELIFLWKKKTCSTATMNLLCSCKSIAKYGCKVVIIGSWVKIVPLGSIIFYWIKEILKKISKQINLTVIFEALIYSDSLGEWSITRFWSSKWRHKVCLKEENRTLQGTNNWFRLQFEYCWAIIVVKFVSNSTWFVRFYKKLIILFPKITGKIHLKIIINCTIF